MTDIYEAIKDWPIIVQGALGSGLFWLILVIGQKVVNFLSEKLSHYTKQSRITWLVSASDKYKICDDNSVEEVASLAALIYRSLRHFYKSILWLVFGLLTNTFIEPLGIIGFVGSMYFLFKASEVVSPIKDGEDVQATYEAIINELNELSRPNESADSSNA